MNVWVNGCFDVLHTGHLNLLEFAKNLKDPKSKYKRKNRLIVGIDSDSRVKELKGSNRPVNNQTDRQRMLEALKCVDEVVIYNNEQEMCMHMEKFGIDYMVIGEDYKNKKVLCREHSVNDVIFYPKDEKSSTKTLERLEKIGSEYEEDFTYIKDLNEGDRFVSKTGTRTTFIRALGGNRYLLKNDENGHEYEVPHGNFPVFKKIKEI